MPFLQVYASPKRTVKVQNSFFEMKPLFDEDPNTWPAIAHRWEDAGAFPAAGLTAVFAHALATNAHFKAIQVCACLPLLL